MLDRLSNNWFKQNPKYFGKKNDLEKTKDYIRFLISKRNVEVCS